MMNCEDGFFGGSYSVLMHSNLVAGDNTNTAEPHSDGFQCAGTGVTTLYHNWVSAGVGRSSGQSIRFGTEFGAVDNVQIHYCALDRGGWQLQLRGDAGAGDISNVDIKHCRWVNNAAFGPHDIEETTGVTWVDNAYMDGTPITYP